MTAIKEDRAWTAAEIERRIVRYRDLKPCYNAFVDTRTPGSEAKENFTIIGPGVSENPAQHVHIAEPHGFNIGGARQPPGCVNSQHSHDTAEVFVVHSGRWRFDLGEHGDDAQLYLSPGDVISIPTHVFRGFTNVGDDLGFLWAVLGGDDPGRVMWAPRVFELASQYGLVLLESGRLIDTTKGEAVPAGERPMPPTSAEQVARLMRATPELAQKLVARDQPCDGETPLIGEDAPLGGGHGFTLKRLDLRAGERLFSAPPGAAEVMFVHRGAVDYTWPDGSTELGEGDTLTFPRELPRTLTARSDTVAFVVRSGDSSAA